MPRDNFTKATIEVLAKRVGYLCSNPKCKRHTIGPNTNPVKTTIIGVAAHITAASPKGPRFDGNMLETERVHINNAIWLCSNCAALIDKNQDKFSVTLLKAWKNNLENEILDSIHGEQKFLTLKSEPFLEADLIWAHSSRMNRGYSNKNPKEISENGQEYILISYANSNAIIFWEIKWNFIFTIHNNSSVPVYNVSIENIGNIKFDSMTNLNKINNLPPFKSLDLEADKIHFLEDICEVADDLMLMPIPQELEGLILKITYQDDERNSYSTITKIKNGEIVNVREK